MKTVGILLAAGASRRFGSEDKLLAPLDGRPLVTHAAEALRGAGVDHLLAVVTSQRVAALLPGFDLVWPDPEPQQSDSLRAGVTRARDLGAEKVAIILGDMPRVPSALIRQVIDRCGLEGSASGDRPMPPACFPAGQIPQLLALTGDQGARDLLRCIPDSVRVLTDPDQLIDIDTPEALVQAHRPTA